MITLYGSPISPFYNKVKIALIEKGVNYEEVLAPPSQEEPFLAKSPMGKIPYVEVNGHPIAESAVILEWLEDAYPTASLLPPTPNGRARARELATLLDQYAFGSCKPLIDHLLFQAPLSEDSRGAALAGIERALAAMVRRRASESTWLAGDCFGYADISATAILPALSFASRRLGSQDLVAQLPGLPAYLDQLRQRPSVARAWADRDAQLATLLAGHNG